MTPIQAALAEAQVLTESGKLYVVIDAKNEHVNMQIGIINDQNERERIHGSISYYMYEGKLRSITHVVL